MCSLFFCAYKDTKKRLEVGCWLLAVGSWLLVLITPMALIALIAPMTPKKIGQIPTLACYSNLDSTTYRYGAVSVKSDFHVDISKYPGGE